MTKLYHKTSFGILNLLSILICSILGMFFGCNVGPDPVEYGMPYADFKVAGTVRSTEQGLPIKGLLVSLRDTLNTSGSIDSVKTDSLGKYSLEFSDAMWDNAWILSVKDIDSIDNGSFIGKDTAISIPESDLKGSDGKRYYGQGEKSVDLNLDRTK